MAQDNILEIKNLKKYFAIHGGLLKKVVGYVKAVDDVSFTVRQGETLGIVGESGCGKSTTGRTILRLLEPTGGQVLFGGVDLAKLGREAMRQKRKDIQMVFQDPYASLNPRMSVADIIGEALPFHGVTDREEIKRRVKETMELCGLTAEQGYRYPHEFSGGQRQRVGIARALVLRPQVIIADEPVSALDVSIQAQIINLLQDLQEQFGLTYLFISHDLSVVRHISKRVGVMYLGRIVEIGAVETLYNHPQHPYTQSLLSAIPLANPLAKRKRIILQGDVPSPANPPSGCAFYPRCPKVMDICKSVRPEMVLGNDGHQVACHLHA
ncbi:oligopeptide/dipeptide ABC transporter ATP-binding protein [Sporomusaceae bacterium BoRhaA]|uniref:ABC transporter ATP-binding protein n=1 Tax=Pelorhabdus rhamnosifermentans TaxID=2772457 RepID=UPI001C063953|nr:dipeptide ABC transporter ATP-binding protein [Pelorhabdus rhamnosifermentans]MBU2700786.1 oligopeptide/dipeptide ABC transporter ATP-binding protein [Pelorhabdus rhamnosifermentans]